MLSLLSSKMTLAMVSTMRNTTRGHFTVRLHVMQRAVFPKHFCPFVCPPVKRVLCDKTICAHIPIANEKSFILFFSNISDKNGWLVATPFTLNFGRNWPCWSENVDFQSIFTRSASAVITSSEKNYTKRKSTMSFPVRLRWTTYVAPKKHKRGLKMQNGCETFPPLMPNVPQLVS